MTMWKSYLRSVWIPFIIKNKKLKNENTVIVGSQIAAHTLMETGNGPNEPNTINL